MLRGHDRGCELDVIVVPRASQTRVAGELDGRLKITLAAPPVDDAANRALIKALAGWLGLPKRSIALKTGKNSRRKTINLAGMHRDEVERWLRAQLES